ncbi:MAG: Maf family protein [Candidatus Excrementavichristensenella sp.]
MARRLYLASSSPRRRELLEGMGIEYVLRAVPTDEETNAPPREAVAVLARRKAEAAAMGLTEGLVLGADTLVALSGKAMGKPRDAGEACAMLEALSGKAHQVYTGVCLVDAATGISRVEVARTDVYFRDLSPEEIRAYVATGESMDKAGAYAIQGGAGKFVERIEGSFRNVMGLPVELLAEMLKGTEV